MNNLKDFTFEQLEQFLATLGQPKFRAKQIFAWLHRGVTSIDEMTDLSKDLRNLLKQQATVSSLKIVQKLQSKIDKTVKYLFELSDGNRIESVVMYYAHGITICISTQVGCRMGCGFCASTVGGLVRNLSAGEILDQVLFASLDIGERISNIVLMGIGEPLDNYENVLNFLKNVNHPLGINVGYRHISLSTCGIVPKILALAEENIPITLSISLHAPNDVIRSQSMPINKSYDIDTLLKACRQYLKVTGRRITFEYAMINGLNDSVDNAQQLASKIKGMSCHVNLIPVNAVSESSYVKSNAQAIRAFQQHLEKKGIPATVRRELGSDIQAACGQLRQQHEQKS
ncbi:MAG: 23S rRNA (adenine(2503)-C(2))-methyltransferase RlmN [Hyphomonadaceae bacterium]|nr:23S rRNA (adenine(2503)-C(2))-methyltransferase RlmN [Clostridia bacterium]